MSGDKKGSPKGAFLFVISMIWDLSYNLDVALSHHSLSNLLEAGDVSTSNQVVTEASFFSSLSGSIMDVSHDGLQLLVDFLGLPAVTHGVLSHFQSGCSYAASVNCLGGSNALDVLLQELQSLVCCGHVSDFDVVLDTVVDHLLSLDHTDFVLVCAGHADINLLAPDLSLGNELNAELVSVVLSAVAAGSTHLEQVVDLLFCDDTVGIVAVAVGTGDCNNLTAQLSNLLANAPSNVTETGNSNCPRLTDYLRITVGSREQMEILTQTLEELL